MSRKILSLFTILFIISAVFAPVYADQTVFGPKDLKIGRWHVHFSSHRFKVNDTAEGVLTIVKNTPDKKIRGGFCFLNGKYIALRNFLKGTGTFFEKDVNLRSKNRLVVFLRGTRGASVKMEIKKKGTTTPPPEVTLTANPSTINGGQSSTLSWTSTFADTCVIQPGIGSVDLNGSVTVSPTVTTTYTITATGSGRTATANSTVTLANSAPVANHQTVTLNEDETASIALTASDANGDALTYQIVTGTSHGTLTGSAPNLIYTPSQNYNGSDSFTFKANDGSLDSNTATINISIRPVNDSPIAANDIATTNEDTALAAIPVLSNDTDPDSDTLSISDFTQPTHGTAGSNGDGTLTYTPGINYNGTDSFTYTVSDGNGGIDTGTVNITINPVSDAPVANNQTVTLNEDETASITLAAFDADGDTLTYQILSNPTHGTLTGNVPNITYTPAENFNGNDAFTFRVNDGTIDSNEATVVITVNPVNDPPVADAGPDQTALQGNVVTLDGSGSSDIDDSNLTYNWTFISVPTDSTATLSDSSAVNPNFIADLIGIYEIRMIVNDGTVNSAPDTVSVNIVALPTVEISAEPLAIFIGESSTLTWTSTHADTCAIEPGIGSVDLNGSIPVSPTETTTYTITATGSGGTATANFTVTIANSDPVAIDQTVRLNEDETASIVLTASDANGDALTYQVVTQPSHGTLTGSSPNLIYTPLQNYNGSDTFTFKANDGSLDSNTATINLSIQPINDTPTAVNDTATTNEDTAIAVIPVLSNDTDPDGDTLSISGFTQPIHGTAGSNGDGTLTYTPSLNYYGTDSFTYTISDGNGDISTATVNITINPVNDAPVANNQTVTLNENETTSITLTASDADGDQLTYQIVSSPSHGTLTGSAPDIIYTPAENYNGSDAFTFKANDGTVDSGQATVTITVNPVNNPPVADAGPDQTALQGNVITLNGSGSSDIDGDSITYNWTFLSVPTGSTATLFDSLLVNPTFTADLIGTYEVQLIVNDGTVNSAPDTVTINIFALPTVEISANPETILIGESSTLTWSSTNADTCVIEPGIGSVAPNGTTAVSPIETTTYTITATSPNGTATDTVTVTVNYPAPILTISADPETILSGESSTLTWTSTNSETCVIEPGIGSVALNGSTAVSPTETTTYTITATGLGGTTTASATVTITNGAPVANDQTVTLNEDETAAITLTASDANGDALTYQVVTGASHGTLTGSVPNLTYTPSLNYNGSDTFTFKANDGTLDSNTATITLSIQPVNDAPMADDQTVTLNEDETASIILTASDADGDVLTYQVVTGPSHGTLTGSAPDLIYTPAENYNGNDTFSFRANDGNLDSNIATISLSIQPVNNVPAAVDDIVTTDEDTAIAAITVLTNDSDPDGDTLTVDDFTQPAHGTAGSNGDGTLTYAPNADFNGTDSFTYTISDGNGGTATATVNITINPVNDAPVANDQTVTLNEDETASITLTASDADGDALTYQIVSNPTQGALTGVSPNLTYM